MSYDHTIYFGADGFQQHAYDAFVANSLRTLGNWHQGTHTPFDLNRDRSLHDYLICNMPGEPADRDWEKSVGVWVGLRRNDPDSCEASFRHYPYYILVETGAGRSPLSMAIQLSVVASTFHFLPDAVAVDDNSDDPENVVTYTQREEFVQHAARVLPRLYDWNQIAHPEMVDGFWTELQRDLKSRSAGGA